MSRRVALLGGSFCPVHIGHVMVASYMAQFSGVVDEVWLVLSPLNPLKAGSGYTLDTDTRLRLLRLAAQGRNGLRVSDVELSLPRPSYTVNTLRVLSERHPDIHFSWLIGSDNLATLPRWRDAGEILRDYGVLVYPRPGYPLPDPLPRGVTAVEAPQVEISSTMIRDGLARGLDMGAFLPAPVWDELRGR